MPTLELPEHTSALPAGPPARQATRALVWKDMRFVGGTLLIVACALIGGVIVNGSDRTTAVWALERPLPAGAVLSADDLVTTHVRLDEAQLDRYIGAEADAPVGQRLAHAIGGGELLATSAVESADVSERRMVTVSIESSRAPVGLSRGDQVDVYVTPRSDAGRSGTTARVLEQGTIETVDAGDRRFGGSSDQLSVVLAVPDEVVERVVAGTRRGDVDLVRVEAGR